MHLTNTVLDMVGPNRPAHHTRCCMRLRMTGSKELMKKAKTNFYT